MAPLILAYDAECALCRRWMARIQARDRDGLIVPFPLQDPLLVQIAPELAGCLLDQALHAVDGGTRRIYAGAGVLKPLLRRLPTWRWLAPFVELPGLRQLAVWAYARVASRRQGCGLRADRDR